MGESKSENTREERDEKILVRELRGTFVTTVTSRHQRAAWRALHTPVRRLPPRQSLKFFTLYREGFQARGKGATGSLLCSHKETEGVAFSLVFIGESKARRE